MKRILARSAVFLLAAIALLYAGDWGVWQLRMSRHTAFSSVEVDQFVAASLKGNKQDYYFAGAAQQECVRSIFPHASDVPCWWLRRHATQWKVIGAAIAGRVQCGNEVKLC